MTGTTLAKYAGKRAAGYSSMPSLDVPILPDVHHCQECGGELRYNSDIPWPKPGNGWQHTSEPETAHYTTPRTRCGYCHTEDPAHVTYVQAAWSDEVRCTRCGGVDGRAIGD